MSAHATAWFSAQSFAGRREPPRLLEPVPARCSSCGEVPPAPGVVDRWDGRRWVTRRVCCGAVSS